MTKKEPNGRVKDLRGERYGMLTVIAFEGVNKEPPKCAIWSCKCDCGNLRSVLSQNLLRGYTWSCGCTNKIGGMLAPGQGARNSLYSQYKHGAIRRGLSFDIDRDLFCDLTRQNCFYCGKEPHMVKRFTTSNGDCIYNGLDRLDNNVGYKNSNVVPCCKNCNRSKSNLSGEEFLSWVYSVAKNQGWIKDE